MRKLVLALGAVVFVLAASLAAFYLATGSQAASTPLPDPLNTSIYAVLAEAGLTEAVVDHGPERTLVAVPLETGMDAESVMFYTMGVVAVLAPDTPRVEVQVYDGDGEPVLAVSARTEDVLAFVHNEISEEAFRARLEKK